MQNFNLEFILDAPSSPLETIRESLIEFGEGLKISPADDCGSATRNFKVCICTQDPTIIFDICAQFGRITSVRINEEA